MNSPKNPDSSVTQVISTGYSFAALKADGSVVTWGSPSYLGGLNSVAQQLSSGVSQIFSNRTAFAALKADGSVVTWGEATNGGDSRAVASQLHSGVSQIVSVGLAFAALKGDGSVVTWGNPAYGGDSSNVCEDLNQGTTWSKRAARKVMVAATNNNPNVLNDPVYKQRIAAAIISIVEQCKYASGTIPPEDLINVMDLLEICRELNDPNS